MGCEGMDNLHALLSMPRFTHLIFDLDGTLADTKADLAAATNFMLAALALPTLTLTQVERFVGEGARVLVARALGSQRADLVPRGFTLFMEYYLAHVLDHTEPYPGMRELLAAAHAQGLRLSVLTNKPEVPSRAILTGLGLADFFGALVGGDTLPVRKPDPQGVHDLQRRTGIDLAATLLIGDSRIDMETGRAAGVSTCGVTWGFDVEGVRTGAPRFVVDSVPQLATLVLSPGCGR
ncbi:MAG: HAD family hydrolase [Deltaproteobacteria bacterium]|nr:HAD family hydrolase [Deltaproteobacteria bacterium]